MGTLVREVMVLGQQHGKHGDKGDAPEEARLVTAGHLADLEALAAARIRGSAEDGTLLSLKTLGAVLYCWRE